jgi:DNA-binding PadR family transcriptional regulator
LNLKKHRCILDELEVNGLIQKSESPFGKRMVIVYKPTHKGIEFCRSILEPYERMFPRNKESIVANNIISTNDATKPIRKASSSQKEAEQQQKQQKLQTMSSEQIVAY